MAAFQQTVRLENLVVNVKILLVGTGSQGGTGQDEEKSQDCHPSHNAQCNEGENDFATLILCQATFWRRESILETLELACRTNLTTEITPALAGPMADSKNTKPEAPFPID